MTEQMELEELVIVDTHPKENVEKSANQLAPKITNILKSFLWERKKAILMRFLAIVAFGFDAYSIYRKKLRNDLGWALAAISIILMNWIIGTLYSIYIAALEKSSASPEENKRPKSGTGFLRLDRSDSVQGFDDKVVHLDLDSDSDSPDIPIPTDPPKKKKKKGLKISFDDQLESRKSNNPPFEAKQKKVGTYIQPGIMDPKMEEQDFIPKEAKTDARLQLSWSRFFIFLKSECSTFMFVGHALLAPKWYHFFRVSKLLWKSLKESYDKDAVSDIEKSGVKRVTYSDGWNEYVYREIMSKQLSLVMAVLQTIPMTFLELIYWSKVSIEDLDTDKEGSITFYSFQGDQVNILELVSVAINIGSIAYRVVSLMNQTRKLDFSRQDMGTGHLIYLTVIYFFLLASRVICLYFVMCLEDSYGLWMTCSILGVQFLTTFLVTRNLVTETNIGTIVISNMLMMFLYMPPKLGRKLTMNSYNLLISFEMAIMFAFGWYYLPKSDVTNPTLAVVGQAIPSSYFFWFYLSSVGVFLLCWTLNSEALSRKIFKYNKHMTLMEIRRVLSDANSKHNTDFQAIVGYHRQEESSFNAEQTIYLF